MSFPNIPRGSSGEIIVHALNRMNSGKINVSADVTLTPSATTTDVEDSRLSVDSVILFDAMTANAAAELAAGSCYISSRLNGICTITHANAGSTDRTFRLLIIG